MDIFGIPLSQSEEASGFVELSPDDILESLLRHQSVASATYENGEFSVVPKPETGERPFKFKIIFDQTCRGQA